MPPVYGNAPAGDHPAAFSHAFEADYPKGKRLLFSFVVLNEERTMPLKNRSGDDLFAVAVCNVSGGENPKSKPFKICRAMLEADEYDAIASATAVPPWQHFQAPNKLGKRRLLQIRVVQKGPAGRTVSIVTHVCRPRDNEWECIEGQFEGANPTTHRPKWLNPDGTAIPFNDKQTEKFVDSHEEMYMWMDWNTTPDDAIAIWVGADGEVVDLSPVALAALNLKEQAAYRIARQRHGKNPFVW